MATRKHWGARWVLGADECAWNMLKRTAVWTWYQDPPSPMLGRIPFGDTSSPGSSATRCQQKHLGIIGAIGVLIICSGQPVKIDINCVFMMFLNDHSISFIYLSSLYGRVQGLSSNTDRGSGGFHHSVFAGDSGSKQCILPAGPRFG